MGKSRRRQPAAKKQAVRAGRLSPLRQVPPSIAAPEYAADGHVRTLAEPSLVKDAATIEAMRLAGRAARRVLAGVAEQISPGVSSDHLDEVAHEACLAEGGYPSPLNYKGYPKSLCTSVNEVICHGIPDDRRLADGDIVNCDVTIFLGGVHGDHSETFLVGEVDEESQRLVRVTREAMYHGIAQVRSGVAVCEIGRAIQAHAEGEGFGVVRDFIGHGIGTVFHQPPNVPHYYAADATFVLESGMTFTVEPMIAADSPEAYMWDDGWTALTVDGSRCAQFEHTVLVTDQGAELMTVGADEPQPFLEGVSKAHDPQRWPAQLRVGSAARTAAQTKGQTTAVAGAR